MTSEPPRVGRRLRITALVAAIALASVSVTAGLVESCSLCPSDCPMHSAHTVAVSDVAARPHCHGDTPLDAGEQDILRRPPCRSSFTLAGSLLPPFVLATAAAGGVTLAPLFAVHSAAPLPDDCRTAPETPPPISFV